MNIRDVPSWVKKPTKSELDATTKSKAHALPSDAGKEADDLAQTIVSATSKDADAARKIAEAEVFMRTAIVTASDLDIAEKVRALGEWENYFRKHRIDVDTQKRERRKERESGIKKKDKYRKYPKDPEAINFLAALTRALASLRKNNPHTTYHEAVKATLDEPDGNETMQQKKQRLNYQCRVWCGPLKNECRKLKEIPPQPTERNPRWKKIFNDWGKHLSCYLKHPPAK